MRYQGHHLITFHSRFRWLCHQLFNVGVDAIIIPKEEAYGEVREELFQAIKNEELPESIKPEVGMGLVARNPDGSETQLRVAEVKEDHIVIDANHPLAGHDLTFELQVVEIE